MNMSPLKVGQEFLVTIKRIGINGEGIGYYKKQAVFIPGTLVGEEVVATCTRVAGGYAEAELVRVKKKSRHRCQPACEVYGQCGGCQLQHMTYPEQLRIKRDAIWQAVERYTNLDPEELDIRPTMGMANPYNYRNRAQMPVGYDEDGVMVGFYSMNSRELVNVTDCEVQYEEINKVVNHAVDLLDDYKVFAYAPKTKKGTARHIVVRRGYRTGEIQVTFVLANKDFKKMYSLALDLMKYCPEVKSVYVNYNSDDTHEIFGPDMIKVAGEDFITDRLGKFKFNLSPRAFYQLNPEQTVKLYNQVKYAASLTGTEKVVDAYCGVGTIGQWVADQASEVRGVDITRAAIIDAKANAKLNNIDNTYYAVGKAESIVPKWANEGFKPDVVIVDPPRTGMGPELIEMLKRVQPKRIVYVSCNPSTLAKNLKELTKKYRVDYIQPIDMFPQTSHVEAVVRLTRMDKSEKVKKDSRR
ncbi:23S rRNA (uracil(1939)-C(5))-methyltransferase RlmD [Turicibacter sanguinis]|jgi:23S rRNA (uracil-5-)-methyltransferase rumA|uniref:23S rRNA (uracil(1939)-C(5))-methyltransferase RlmD n=1 Tax=Turicibacter sanguinis TaxID=154288 RepID=UPI0012B7A8D8|nr:23S rRNA (uracil(1939)-C(5))-methyltransferase RlmD [Turicibacter sanguinis]MDB8555609.1 23S rRNA (uracil(1939)-C(5))-methyltransferase RlmD [Turicibacter sanguinis]MTH06484.1 23S rRNA (uracil(1939)-C(5))-methyltransferase RlmD [Turicibacter sanguinis]MTH09833.1 23S rRNA (uracil(1939)-C(5))-methyltransferase RlmD [Turicibacter sanguinis]MTH12625.1 23S rRNA (uracil(1939)-C(5))-methyltransferase RlmD [Turicibacter sanguinis]MTH19457.1 23S rRNA (uracil(1939)-C(5))-methyltransferase RlmD [Turic